MFSFFRCFLGFFGTLWRYFWWVRSPKSWFQGSILRLSWLQIRIHYPIVKFMAGPIACRLKLIQRKYTQQSAKKGKIIAKKGKYIAKNDASSTSICTILLKKGFFKISKSKLHFFSWFSSTILNNIIIRSSISDTQESHRTVQRSGPDCNSCRPFLYSFQCVKKLQMYIIS